MNKRVSGKNLSARTDKGKRRIPVIMALAVTLTMLLTMVLGSFTAWAAEGSAGSAAAGAAGSDEEYTYTVRILGGAQGKVTGGPASANGVSPSVSGSDIVYTGLKKGDRISFDTSHVTVNKPDKYRASVIRLSGRDNQDLAARVQSFTVNEDRDCVVAYNVKSANELTYTIYYRDAAGNNIADPVTLHGNNGETMVVGAKWSDTHFPNTYNREIEFGNGDSYTFTYQPNPTPTPVPTPTPAPVQQQTIVVSGGGTAGTGTGTAGTETGTAGTGTGTAGTGTGTAGTGTGTTQGGGTAGTAGTAGQTGTAGAAGQTGTTGGTEPGATGAGTGTGGQTGTTGGTEPGTTGAGTGTGGQTGAAGTTGTGAGAGTQGGTESTAQAGQNAPTNPQEVPEILDINDEEVPLANFPGSGNETGNGTSVSGGNKTGTDGGNTTDNGNTTGIDSGDKPGGLSTGAKAGIAAGFAAAAAVIAALIVKLKKSSGP